MISVVGSHYDIVFTVDASGSMSETQYYQQFTFIESIIDNLPFYEGNEELSTRVGVLVYSDRAHTVINLNSYTSAEQIKDALYAPFYAESTNTAEAFKVIRDDMFTQSAGKKPFQIYSLFTVPL